MWSQLLCWWATQAHKCTEVSRCKSVSGGRKTQHCGYCGANCSVGSGVSWYCGANCSVGGQIKITNVQKYVCVNLCQAGARPRVLAETAQTLLGDVSDFHFILWTANATCEQRALTTSILCTFCIASTCCGRLFDFERAIIYSTALKGFHMETNLPGRMPTSSLEPFDWSGNSVAPRLPNK